MLVNNRTLWLLFLHLFISPVWGLSGVVVNKTLNRPEGNVVVSYVQHVGNDVTVLRDTTTATGQFDIPVQVDVNADPPPMLFAQYLNVDYPGKVDSETIEIPVYETTNADTAISLMSHHILINAQTREITYILIVQNRSDRTYLSEGDHGHGLELPLPDGVTDVLQAPQGVHLHGNVIVDPRPIVPGNGQTFFTFVLPTTHQFAQQITYPTSSLDMLVQPSETEVTVAGLHDHGTVTMGTDAFRRFGAVNLVPGTQVSLTIGSEEWVSQQTLVWMLAGLAVIFGGIAVVVARRPRGISSMPDRRRQVLLEQLADLDDRFERGDLSESDYQSQRQALKTEVANLSSDQQRLIEQMAELDDQFEKGTVPKDQYQKKRDALKKQIVSQRLPR